MQRNGRKIERFNVDRRATKKEVIGDIWRCKHMNQLKEMKKEEKRWREMQKEEGNRVRLAGRSLERDIR